MMSFLLAIGLLVLGFSIFILILKIMDNIFPDGSNPT